MITGCQTAVTHSLFAVSLLCFQLNLSDEKLWLCTYNGNILLSTVYDLYWQGCTVFPREELCIPSVRASPAGTFLLHGLQHVLNPKTLMYLQVWDLTSFVWLVSVSHLSWVVSACVMSSCSDSLFMIKVKQTWDQSLSLEAVWWWFWTWDHILRTWGDGTLNFWKNMKLPPPKMILYIKKYIF